MHVSINPSTHSPTSIDIYPHREQSNSTNNHIRTCKYTEQKKEKLKACACPSLSPSNAISQKYANTHTHTYIYIYVYIDLCITESALAPFPSLSYPSFISLRRGGWSSASFSVS